MKNYLIYPTKIMSITQNYSDNFSHKPNSTGTPKDYPIDENCGSTGRDYFYCPCETLLYTCWNTLSLMAFWKFLLSRYWRQNSVLSLIILLTMLIMEVKPCFCAGGCPLPRFSASNVRTEPHKGGAGREACFTAREYELPFIDVGFYTRKGTGVPALIHEPCRKFLRYFPASSSSSSSPPSRSHSSIKVL